MTASMNLERPPIDSQYPCGKVYLVDDDPDVRRSIGLLVSSIDLAFESYANADDFLKDFTHTTPACLLLDVRMPGTSGLELQQKLVNNGHRIPTIILTGHAEVWMATQAMQAGAVDFIEKPHSPQVLLERIQEAIRLDEDTLHYERERIRVSKLVEKLSPREVEVKDLLVLGLSTKQIGSELRISGKTVDNHRGHILDKMEVDSVPALVRLVTKYLE